MRFRRHLLNQNITSASCFAVLTALYAFILYNWHNHNREEFFGKLLLNGGAKEFFMRLSCCARNDPDEIAAHLTGQARSEVFRDGKFVLD
jgi:hypothetical protein